MRPTPIPDDEVWENSTRRVIGPPRGDLDSGIGPVEVLTERREQEGPMMHVRVLLEDDDLRRIGNGDHVFWLTFISDHLHPFEVQMGAEDLVQAPECRSCGGPLVTGDNLVQGYDFGGVEMNEETRAEAAAFWFHSRLADADTCGAPDPKWVRRDGKPGPT